MRKRKSKAYPEEIALLYQGASSESSAEFFLGLEVPIEIVFRSQVRRLVWCMYVLKGV